MERARKLYGNVEALSGVDLRIEAGEVVAMLGPNGAGKTTAISLMLGLRRPTSGRVRLLGSDPAAREARARVGVMLQESGVPEVLTVAELVRLFRSYYPRPLPADDAIAAAGLQGQARKRVSALSGGQRQRLYYALAICGDPEVLFLDEPTVGMDVEARRSFWQGIRHAAARGRTVILTTHYLEEADALASRIVVVAAGRVVADAPPAAIKSRFGARRLSFRVADGWRDGLADGLPVRTMERNGDRVLMLSAEPERVLRGLFERGAEITDLVVAGADLEEAVASLAATA